MAHHLLIKPSVGEEFTVKDVAELSQLIADNPGCADWLLDQLQIDRKASCPEIAIALAEEVL